MLNSNKTENTIYEFGNFCARWNLHNGGTLSSFYSRFFQVSFIKVSCTCITKTKNKFLLQFDPNPAVRKIHDYQLMTIKDFPVNYEEAYNILCNKQRQAILAFNYRIIKSVTPCPIIRVSESVVTIYTGISLRPGSSYRGIFNEM